MLRKQTKTTSVKKRPAVKETSRFLVLPAGDNSAESTLGNVKKTMRRVGNVGRFNSKKPTMKNVEVLAAAALLRKSGYDRVLEALREYRVACSTGKVRVAPRYAFDAEHCEWLYTTSTGGGRYQDK